MEQFFTAWGQFRLELWRHSRLADKILDIIVALFWGAVSGESKSASRRSLAYCWTGIGVLLVSIGIISAANIV